MAASTASMAALRAPVEIANPATQAARVFASSQAAVKVAPKALVVRAQAESTQSRRSVLSLIAATVAAGALASEAKAVSEIKIEGPPPPSGGLPGTKSADQARDTDAPLKERFYLQPLPPAEALARAKESAEQIVGVKALIEKKAWPYVQNDLRSKASYLRFDLSTVISSLPKPEKKELTDLSNKLYDSIAKLDYAARTKSPDAADKSYDETVALLKQVFDKLG